MTRKLRLQRFKNFRDATLTLGNFTLLVGMNAAGKSNLQDALRFLHGIGRGYTLTEIISEKWIEGGVLQWSGIRGGVREIAFCNTRTFAVEMELLTVAGTASNQSEAELSGRCRWPVVRPEDSG